MKSIHLADELFIIRVLSYYDHFNTSKNRPYIYGAEALGILRDVGTIEAGKCADLVVLTAMPAVQAMGECPGKSEPRYPQ